VTDHTPYRESDSLFNLLESIEHAVALALTSHSRSVNEWRRIVGWSDPPQDCCPEIAVWGGNLRPDPTTMYPGQGGVQRPSCSQQWLYDVTIRVSQCFIDLDENGGPLDADQINSYSRELYAIKHDAYNGFWCRWVNGQITEIDGCTPMMIGPTVEYADGGCGGMQFTVTVRMGVD
jgi:hypothetical protein